MGLESLFRFAVLRVEVRKYAMSKVAERLLRAGTYPREISVNSNNAERNYLLPLLHSEYYPMVYLPLIDTCENTGEIMERHGELGQWIMALDIKPLYQDVFFKEAA